LNSKLISNEVGTNYPYKAIIDTLLFYGHDVKESMLQSEMYYKDTAGKMDQTPSATNLNVGLSNRNELTKT
jgi:hypothetical protein